MDAVARGAEQTRTRQAETAALLGLRQRFETLSPRERGVMALVRRGLLNKQIAQELQLSEITVKVHRGKVMRKLQVQSLPELFRFADRLPTALKA